MCVARTDHCSSCRQERRQAPLNQAAKKCSTSIPSLKRNRRRSPTAPRAVSGRPECRGDRRRRPEALDLPERSPSSKPCPLRKIAKITSSTCFVIAWRSKSRKCHSSARSVAGENARHKAFLLPQTHQFDCLEHILAGICRRGNDVVCGQTDFVKPKTDQVLRIFSRCSLVYSNEPERSDFVIS